MGESRRVCIYRGDRIYRRGEYGIQGGCNLGEVSLETQQLKNTLTTIRFYIDAFQQ